MKITLDQEKDKTNLLPRKKRRQLERKLIKVKRNAWHHRQKVPMSIDILSSSIEQEENLKKKKKKKKKKNKSSELTIDENIVKEHHRKILIEDNEAEDANIRKLEKLLKIKSDRKSYLRGFVNDGLDYLLDFCDKDRRKQIMMAEGDGEGNAWYDQEDEDQQWLTNKQKQKVQLANQTENNFNQEKRKKKKTSVVKFNEQIQTKIIDDESMEDDEDFDDVDESMEDQEDVDESMEDQEDVDEEEFDDEEKEEEEEETPTMKEDIYGRMIDAKGNIVKNDSNALYIPPALRQKMNSSDDNSIVELKRSLHGQLNRLSEKNFSSILGEIEKISRFQSRASINSCLYKLYHDSILSSLSLTNESLIAEHALLVCLLHTNVGLEIGSYLFENFLQIFIEHINDEISNKINDNLIIFISYLYAFYMTNGKILYDIARYLLNNEQINEKRLELILLLLKTVGFILRKDNPLELKTFLQELRTICSSSALLLSSSSKRLEFMMDTIKSLKNNDVRKLPGGFQPERIDRLRKIYRNLVKDKTIQQTNMLNVGLQDFLNVKEQGRWWIVGSAWQKQTLQDKKTNNNNNQQFNQKINKLAKQQHINTDIRRLIFGTLLTSEDCDDAVEKLHKLNLSKVQEREIIHVTVHCCLHEKTYNPYYTLILQRFCSYDRRFQISLQYHTWDRFKDLSLLNDQQLSNLSSTLSQLLISKSITLNIFKNFNFIELTLSARTFLVELFVKLFNETDDKSLKSIFQFSSTQNYKFVKDALRLFLSHFILKKSNYSELVHNRCQIMYEDYFSIDDILSTQERIRCQLLVDIPKLGFLESSSLHDEKKEEENSSSLTINTKLELPYWMIYSICNCKTRFASLPELPLIYSRIQRQIFAADASVVDLAKQAPHFYRQGRHLLELNFDEKRQVAITLLQTYQQRFRSIMDSAFHLVLSNDHHHHESMKHQTAKFERQEKILLLLGQAAFRDYDRLVNNETKQMLPPKIQGMTNDLTNLLAAANNRKRKR